jgi:hypothetical protein
VGDADGPLTTFESVDPPVVADDDVVDSDVSTSEQEAIEQLRLLPLRDELILWIDTIRYSAIPPREVLCSWKSGDEIATPTRYSTR